LGKIVTNVKAYISDRAKVHHQIGKVRNICWLHRPPKKIQIHKNPHTTLPLHFFILGEYGKKVH
jgi:hypothetical protein